MPPIFSAYCNKAVGPSALRLMLVSMPGLDQDFALKYGISSPPNDSETSNGGVFQQAGALWERLRMIP
jgi:hypothetical protein